MNLKMNNQKILVCGASSGFGYEIAKRIVVEGGVPILVARSEEKLKEFKSEYPESDYMVADLFEADGVEKVMEKVGPQNLDGVLINSGGPQPGSFSSVELSDWDEGYEIVLRWKIDLLRRILPAFQNQNYGRIVFIESVSVKQPLNGLILSNVFRIAVKGLMKSIVNEMEGYDITLNLLAPGYHRTDRLNHLIARQSEDSDLSQSEIAENMAAQTPLRSLGDPASLAQLGAWLLSSQNSYVTGQSFVIDGGMSRGL